MMDMTKLEAALSDLPLYEYFEFTSSERTFSDRIRWICEHECPMYGKSWACPPGVGTVGNCKVKCLGYKKGLCVSTIVEVADISDINETLATRPAHEEVTEQVAELMKQCGAKETYILSTEACAVCERCAILDGQPCRFPEKMHPCVESHGINVIPAMESLGVPFISGENVVTWVSLLFFNE